LIFSHGAFYDLYVFCDFYVFHLVVQALLDLMLMACFRAVVDMVVVSFLNMAIGLVGPFLGLVGSFLGLVFGLVGPFLGPVEVYCLQISMTTTILLVAQIDGIFYNDTFSNHLLFDYCYIHNLTFIILCIIRIK
jgi:hypothetical protein